MPNKTQVVCLLSGSYDQRTRTTNTHTQTPAELRLCGWVLVCAPRNLDVGSYGLRNRGNRRKFRTPAIAFFK